MVQPVERWIFLRVDTVDFGEISRIGRLIIELSIFGGLKVIQDYFQLLNSPFQIHSDADIAG